MSRGLSDTQGGATHLGLAAAGTPTTGIGASLDLGARADSASGQLFVESTAA